YLINRTFIMQFINCGKIIMKNLILYYFSILFLIKCLKTHTGRFLFDMLAMNVVYLAFFGCQELYRQFSDVILNDNTCKTNKYHMYLSVFMVKDNYGRFRNVANALVEDELSSTYIWILQCLLKATDNTVPKSFWSDSEPRLI